MARSFVLLASFLFLLFESFSLAVNTCSDQSIVTTEFLLDSQFWFAQWMGESNKVVFVQSWKKSLYRSKDEGKTWEKQVLPSNNNAQGVNSLFSSPADPNKIWLVGSGNVWITDNAGETYTQLTDVSGWSRGISFFSILPHRTLADWALGFGRTKKCVVPSATGNCYYYLYLTKDFGTSWNLIDTYVDSFTWGKELHFTDSYVYYTSQETHQGDQSLEVGPRDLIRLNVESGQKNVMYKNCLAVRKSPFNDSIIFAVEPDSDGGVSLLISEDDGEYWTPAVFPFELAEKGYDILEEVDGAVFVGVAHGDPGSKNIYLSNNFGTYFSLSLERNKVGYYGSDFVKMSGIDGIYVANQIDLDNIGLTTKITYDMGGEWQSLRKPTRDSQGNPVSCPNIPDDKCHLNLFGLNENVYGRFYSVPGAIGIIIATGNVGEFLSTSGDINTYVSRDAGWTWEEIKKGSLTYEIGDNGALLVFAQNGQKTDRILYSWNEGLNFTECQFTQSGALSVSNIVVDPKWASEQFILYGTTSSNLGLLVHLDFSGFHARECKNPDKAGQAESDYELWSPSDLGSDQCLLGAHTTYTRRKRDSNCYNPQKYDTIVSSSPCECKREDYDCDYCFISDGQGGDCVLNCPNYNPATPPPNCRDVWWRSVGYRLIPGDRCQNGLDLRPTLQNCSEIVPENSMSTSTLNGARIFGFVVLALFLSAIVGCLIFLGVVLKTGKPVKIYDKLSGFKDLFSRKNNTTYSQVPVDEPELE